jgi:hypothetical protein
MNNQRVVFTRMQVISFYGADLCERNVRYVRDYGDCGNPEYWP